MSLIWLMAVSITLILILPPPIILTQVVPNHHSIDVVNIEPLTPFTSCRNLKTYYGAIGDGLTDDTAKFQLALSEMGFQYLCLYIPSGLYPISKTLSLMGAIEKGGYGWGGLSIMGESPSTVTIKWVGQSGDEAMLVQNGGFATSYSRITWDGSGLAKYGIAHHWNTSMGLFYDGSAEHLDSVYKNMFIGIMAGRLGKDFGQLNSEGTVRRVKFYNCTYAGVDLGEWNALDWWIIDSYFADNARAVTNTYSIDDSGVTNGAGAFYVYRTVFERSTVSDIHMGNTGWFSVYHSVSSGSNRFFQADGIGRNPAIIILVKNRVVNCKNANPISLGNLGPLILMDNEIVSSGYPYVFTDWELYQTALSIGNKFTKRLEPYRSTSRDKKITIDDMFVDASSISTDLPALQPTPSLVNHEVFEVPVGANASTIQNIVNQALKSSDSQPIVHFKMGNWYLKESISIPQGSKVQIVGDGFSTSLIWQGVAGADMFNIKAPTRVTIRNIRLLGSGKVRLSGVDTPGGRIQGVQSVFPVISANNIVNTHLAFQTNTGISGINLNAVSNINTVGLGGLGPMYMTNNSKYLMADTWYEGSATNLYSFGEGVNHFYYIGGVNAPASHSGESDYNKSPIELDNFKGSATWIGILYDLSHIPGAVGVKIKSENVNSQITVLGSASGSADMFFREDKNGDGQVGNILAMSSGLYIWREEGDTSQDRIRNALKPIRELVFDTTPYQVPSGATDIVFYRAFMDIQGLQIDG